jgi:integron integrase
VELRFDRGFTQADVTAVKSIPGRRWQPDQRVWVLPDTPGTLNALTRSFGSRLVLSGVSAVGHGTRPSLATASSLAGSEAPLAAGTPSDASPPGDRVTPAPGRSLGPEAERVLDAMCQAIRIREYSRKTERAYVAWTRRFLRFHADRVDRPESLNAEHARAFLDHLTSKDRLAAKSRNQAASALGFMFREVLGRDEMAGIPRAKGPKHIPLVLSHREVLRVFRELTGKYFLIAVLLYSAGLRIKECLHLRVKDVDFDLRQILVRDGKGRKDRYVPLAQRAVDLLRAQMRRVAELHDKDRAAGHAWAALPGALHRKDPAAGYELGWQFVFPATSVNEDPATGRSGRSPLHITAAQREMKRAVRRSGLTKRATCHTLRHSFATEALRGGCDIRTLQHVMGHKDIRTTMIYLHVLEQSGFHMRSPLDRPDDPEDYDPDPIGRPWAGMEEQWDLAARQWEASPRPQRTDRTGVPQRAGSGLLPITTPARHPPGPPSTPTPAGPDHS